MYNSYKLTWSDVLYESKAGVRAHDDHEFADPRVNVRGAEVEVGDRCPTPLIDLEGGGEGDHGCEVIDRGDDHGEGLTGQHVPAGVADVEHDDLANRLTPNLTHSLVSTGQVQWTIISLLVKSRFSILTYM